MAVDPIDPINVDYTTAMEAARAAHPVDAAGRAAAPAERISVSGEAARYIGRLNQNYPGLKFTLGAGAAALSAGEKEAMGKGNVMIDPNFAVQLQNNPQEADRYGKVFGELADAFDRLFSDAMGDASALVAWGTFLNFEGAFGSWGVTDPFTDTLPAFARFDAVLMADLVKFGTQLYETELDGERDMFRMVQNLEKAEAETDRPEAPRPTAIGKQEAIRAYRAEGTDAPREGARLDERD